MPIPTYSRSAWRRSICCAALLSVASGDMGDQISGKQFDESDGVQEWRALWGGGMAGAYFVSGWCGAGAGLVEAMVGLSAVVGHRVDVEVRHEGITFRLFTNE